MVGRLHQTAAAPATLLIAGARLVDPGSGLDGERLDVLVREGTIAEIVPGLDAACVERV